jgi:hypothetical protein
MEQVMSSEWFKAEMQKFHDWFNTLLKESK